MRAYLIEVSCDAECPMPDGGSYAHSPITEAIIELRYDGAPEDLGVVEAARPKFATDYPRAEALHELSIQVGREQATSSVVGYKLTSSDGSRVVQLRPTLVATSKLAPYEGWTDFTEQLRSVQRKAAPIFKGRRLVRIGTRFINRFDIPNAGHTARHDEYFTVGISEMPFEHGPIGLMAFNISSVLENGRFGFTLRSGRVFAPLVEHVSVVLDVDIYDQEPATLPRTQKATFAALDEMHVWMRTIFEASITDKARELIA